MIDDLIARVAAATKPSRELDADICAVTYPGHIIFNLTSKIDAIVFLIRLQLHCGFILEARDNGHARAGISQVGYHPSEGPTPALALCLAFLRAWKEKEAGK